MNIFAIRGRFRRHEITFPSCITRLDAALVRFMLRMKIEDRDELRIVMLANNEAVMKEAAQRGAQPNPEVAAVTASVRNASGGRSVEA